MSGFSFNSPQNTENELIKNDGYFPNIDTNILRESVKLDGSVTNRRLKDSITNAMLEVNRQLATLKNRSPVFNDLARTSINDIPETEILYFRAIHSAVAADVNEKYQAYDSTGKGQKNSAELDPTIDDHRRNLRWAIRDLLGISRCTVDLI